MSGDPRIGVKPTPCPDCGAKLDGATGVGHSHRPKEGDATVCFRCACVLVFTSTCSLRKADAADLEGDSEARDLLFRIRDQVLLERRSAQ